MFYSLLGRIVWAGLKLFLRRKYGRTYVPKSLLAGRSLEPPFPTTSAKNERSRCS